jgi:hypothetical protein
MPKILSVAWRYAICLLGGGAAGVLTAANWPNPDSVAAGALLGVGGIVIGHVLGMWWASSWAEGNS